MAGFVLLLIGIAAALTLYVLVRGIVTMARGRDITGQQSNKLMTLRVGFQALTIILVVVLFVLAGKGMGS